ARIHSPRRLAGLLVTNTGVKANIDKALLEGLGKSVNSRIVFFGTIPLSSGRRMTGFTIIPHPPSIQRRAADTGLRNDPNSMEIPFGDEAVLFAALRCQLVHLHPQLLQQTNRTIVHNGVYSIQPQPINMKIAKPA